MIHGSDRFTHEFNRWMMGFSAFERITTAYESRGYATTSRSMPCLYFWDALREAGYDDVTIDGMREERYANFLW